MPDTPRPRQQNTRDSGEPRSSNHVIWGMTAGLLLGSALGFLIFDQVAVGVAIGIALGVVLATILKGRVP